MKAEMIWYVVRCVRWLNCMVSKFTSRLLQSGYPMLVISSAVAKVSHANRPKYLLIVSRATHSASAIQCDTKTADSFVQTSV